MGDRLRSACCHSAGTCLPMSRAAKITCTSAGASDSTARAISSGGVAHRSSSLTSAVPGRLRTRSASRSQVAERSPAAHMPPRRSETASNCLRRLPGGMNSPCSRSEALFAQIIFCR